jgi:hypothetical protein
VIKEYEVGDIVERLDKSGRWGITRRYSVNPGGPMTYYDVYELETSYPTETIHLSQIISGSPIALYAPSIREEVLDEAKRIVMKDRNTNYGSPEDNFRDIAEMWTTYSGHKFYAHDVAAMMILLKISRIKTSPGVRDHWVDVPGYSACGAQAYSVTMDEEL